MKIEWSQRFLIHMNSTLFRNSKRLARDPRFSPQLLQSGLLMALILVNIARPVVLLSSNTAKQARIRVN